MESPFEVNADWLVKNGLKHVYQKTGEGRYAYQFTKEALKKGLIASLETRKGDGGQVFVELRPGPKFALTEFLQSGFKRAGKADWQRIRVEARKP